MRLMLSKYGDQLNTRDAGEAVRNEIEACLLKSHVIIDFERVEGITQSCADEILGVLILKIGFEQFRNKVAIANTNDEVKSVLKYVITQRRNANQQ